ncbi:helix-turn-helix domain-containing protein [Microbacterium sp. KNMS]
MVGVAQFDRHEVLLSSARTFAEHGFEACSVNRLVDATGLQRGSLYGAFGSKAGLFREAFKVDRDERRSKPRDRSAHRGSEGAGCDGPIGGGDLEAHRSGNGGTAVFGRRSGVLPTAPTCRIDFLTRATD